MCDTWEVSSLTQHSKGEGGSSHVLLAHQKNVLYFWKFTSQVWGHGSQRRSHKVHIYTVVLPTLSHPQCTLKATPAEAQQVERRGFHIPLFFTHIEQYC